MNLIDRIIMKLCRSTITKYANRVITCAYECGAIKSDHMHFLLSYYDKTQKPFFADKSRGALYADMRRARHH